MTEIKGIRNRLQKAHYERMKDIYKKCEEKGFPSHYADTFYWRLTESPLNHTKNVIAHSNEEGISRLKTLLEIMLEALPSHEKAEEWQKALKLFK